MSNLIWDKGAAKVDEEIQKFTAGDDVILDRQLLDYDIQASIAHVRGLRHIEVLTEQESAELISALEELRERFAAGEFILDERFEDGHSAIEAFLTEKLGDTGKKVHTGRSRNDQVLVAQRLFLKDALQELGRFCGDIAAACLSRAEESKEIAMPGYTHLQRAVPSSLAMWFAAYAEAFIDNAALAAETARWLNANPLGTAAGYGVNLPLHRDGISADLGFERLQISPIYAQNSRGKFELQTIMAYLQALLDLRRLAWDLSLFTTSEFAFVDLPDSYTTGSSIMPNKRNPDVVELLRAATSPAIGAFNETLSLLSLPAGYHRDLQNTKEPVLRALRHGRRALRLVPNLMEHLRFDAEKMAAAIDGPMHATDLAVELTSKGLPFRDAYRQVGAELGNLDHRSPQESLKARTSPGGAAELLLPRLQSRLDALALGNGDLDC